MLPRVEGPNDKSLSPMSHLQRMLRLWSEGEGGLRFFTAIRQKKNPRDHDKGEQHSGPPAGIIVAG